MKIIAAYLLAVLGCNASPSAADIKSILSSVGAEAEDEMIDLLLSEVSGKDITELIASGREKFASVPSGGGSAVVPPVSGGGAPADATVEAKKEEKVEIVEEEDDDMCIGLFD